MKRSTVIALALLALVAGLYWYTRQEDNLISAALAGTPTPAPNMPGYLVEPYARSVTALSVRKSNGAELGLVLKEGQWALTSGAVSDSQVVDQTATDSAVSNVQSLRILSQIESPNNLADFGLEAENVTRIQVTFEDNSTLTVRVGKLTPTGSGYYALDESQPNTVLILAKMSIEALLSLPANPPLLDSLESTPAP